MRLAALLALVVAAPAAGQTPACDVEVPKPYPAGRIAITVSHRFGDAANVEVGGLLGRCVGGRSTLLDVCGTATHRGSGGVVDRSAPFFGRFDLTAPGQAAVAGLVLGGRASRLCAERVIGK